MNKCKRILLVLLVILCVLIMAAGIFFSLSGKTVDLVGTVISVDHEKGEVLIIGTADDVFYRIGERFYTSVKDGNERISFEEMESGDLVSVNYRGKWQDENTVLPAISIEIVG